MIHNKRETQLHFVGIGGIGMSGIAEVFLNQGYRVSGSDLADSDSTRHLRSLGAKVAIGHAAKNVEGAAVVIISSAVKPDNPEVLEARRLHVPVIPRAEMLGELMRSQTGIAIAGTHGKTTTTSMMATVLTVAGMDPTIVVGGRVDSLGGNAKLGKGQFVVAEADESDASFLHLPASFAVVTNIDNDHLDHYGTVGAIEDAFEDFVAKLPFYGLAAVCGEDPGVRRCFLRWTKPVVTYGFTDLWDYWATDVKVTGLGSAYDVNHRGSGKLGRIELNVPGQHNVLNSLAVVALSLRLGLTIEKIAEGLRAFRGVKRRFEIRWKDEARKKAIVDDYGHHPTEITATLQAARSWWPGRIIVVFQPHRYSRTLHCRDGFLSAFRNADVVLMTDIYAAGEEPIQGVSAGLLADDVRRVALPNQVIEYVGSLEAARTAVLTRMTEGDLVLCMGAGTITKLPEQLVAAVVVPSK